MSRKVLQGLELDSVNLDDVDAEIANLLYDVNLTTQLAGTNMAGDLKASVNNPPAPKPRKTRSGAGVEGGTGVECTPPPPKPRTTRTAALKSSQTNTDAPSKHQQ